ncbi:L,D-transpeptidase-like protein [Novosphingobium kunmingense]|uniref:L,D-transpeptidase-like protein n=1 Tax=Novosphingobium kunmingense TaxID=1211806 RepID=A0A2N0H709_9SPHN|nr:L,D-transpeptidase family protein [Novosphingobium kunmingense]PKB14716.1 L,D-transpeptidase-like protein [Novosphingobium kunmingense]
MPFKPTFRLMLLTGLGLALLAFAWLALSPRAPASREPLPPTNEGAFAEPLAPPSAAARNDSLVIKRILPIAGPIKYGEWHWDAKNVPQGSVVITVDLEARVLSVFQGGYEIGATAVLLGTAEKPTPLGLFPVKWKKQDHYSSTYDGAPMPHTMNLTPDGVAIHGTKVEKGYASHGCIGVPDAFAARLFAVTPVGTPVYITKGMMAKLGDSLT